ncbi:hypothetical protein N7541_005418 [Penicillium brevicompactum]|uniref:Amino acid transporter transmembrane domain-containing protein n=1 Tax=Penicillium brevicompactum TaxID=5074 RepID=A0A9W9UE11_PENBR|nr:uncharacterized protein N7506_005277 [Penicillium brevicompactum]KAJ5335594.1 hypothetical protein N7452_007997 [Penicillium brevicompactum]KAJ5337255.1 hypothetical protein N7506_005277 [Penicillium brevicompactum]KAJ5358260.1 hypothetical protein N7541_005418 [Penicillium brevicompactum]
MSMLPGPMAVTAPTEQVRETVSSPEDIDKMVQAKTHPGVLQRQWGLEARLDPNVTFEEFTYWAKIERELEDEEYRRFRAVESSGILGHIKGYFGKNAYEDDKVINSRNLQSQEETSKWSEKQLTVATNKDENGINSIPPSDTHDLDAEWRTAARALKNASWGAVFYLITTDILGWSQTPYVFSNTGYGLGVGIFVLMGLAAFASGMMIWRTFLALDSSRFPVMSFGDPFFRLYGPRMRHFINFMQSLQMFLSVAVVLLGNTGIIAQLAGSANLCFVVCGIISLVVGMASGYMRSLKHLGWFCNFSVWINIVTFVIICVAAAKHGPDPAAAVQNGVLNKAWATVATMAPVKTFVNTPPAEYQPTDTNLFAAQFNGINSMVYAYSGAVMFVAFLSEMRRPMDFWKGLLMGQTFITVVYVFFGAFIYNYYGQYAYSNVNQSVYPLNLQVVGNVLSLITGWLAVFLYFNVGMKTVYLEVGQEIFNLPPIASRKGKYIWWALGPMYWIIAFVVSMSIPQFSAFTNFVGGLFSLNFTYSLSGVMYLAYKIQDGARLPGEGFDPATGETVRLDGGIKRWVRGFVKTWYLSIPVLIYTGCGLATSGMGTWAAVSALESAFGPGGSVVTSWTCVNPYYNP